MHHAIIGCVLAGFVLLTGRDLPNRVKQDNRIEAIKHLVEERLIAPLVQESCYQFPYQKYSHTASYCKSTIMKKVFIRIAFSSF